MILPPALRHFVCLDTGKVWVAPPYAELFRRHGLTEFAHFMHYQAGERIKKNRYREILRFALPGTANLFLKRHFVSRLTDDLRSWLSLRRPESPAWHEAVAIGLLQEVGVVTLQPVAFGHDPTLFGAGASFLITEELTGTKLQYYLPANQQKWQQEPAFRHELIRRLADMARAMHINHLHHQDFYLGHILIAWDQNNSGFQLKLLDLQRMHRRKPLARRWRIKDLAELHYGAPAPLVSHSDRLRFWYHYYGDRRLTATARRWLFAIERWRCKIAIHQAHKQARAQRQGK